MAGAADGDGVEPAAKRPRPALALQTERGHLAEVH
eukprot:gene8148-5735_t